VNTQRFEKNVMKHVVLSFYFPFARIVIIEPSLYSLRTAL